MNTISTIIAIAVFVLASLIAPGDNDLFQPANKSPCFEEDVYACRASGGTFNWSHCTCE